MRRLAVFLTSALGLLAGSAARAVDESEIKVADRWSVVGIISGDETQTHPATGIAVLRNNTNKHTYTLTIGDSLPMEFGFVLQAVKARTVVVAKGRDQFTLSFADGAQAEEAPETPSRSQRFLDSYYRSFGDGSVEVLERDDTSQPSGGFQRFGTLKDEGRSRFDLYRPDRPYHLGTAGEGSGFVVNYDNFDDEQNDEEKSESGGAAFMSAPADQADQAVDESAPAF